MLGPTLKRFSASPLSVLLYVTLLLQVTVTVVYGQGQDATPGQCKCVPYYLCGNGTIVTSGRGLIDERTGGGLKCDNMFVKCCYKSMKSKAPEDMNLTTQDIDKTISGEMSTPIPQKMTPDTCKCVPYYLCGNRTIVTSGRGLIDERVGRDMKCSGILDVCCNESMILEKPQEKDKIIDKMIWEMYSTPKPPTMPSDTCKCVPYYLCGNGTIVTSGRGLIDERFRGNEKCSGILDVCCNESMKSKEASENDVKRNNLDKAIWSVFHTPPYPPPPSDRCTCVPHNLCRNKTINVARKSAIIDIRINKDRCPNSIDVCCYDPIKSTKPTEIPEPVHRTICGHWNPLGVKFTITGDSHNEAQFGEFPWMVAILKLESNQSKTYICGGSLIHPRVVLTAFHCVKNKNPNELVIRAGEWDTQTENEPLPSQDGQALKIINRVDFEPYELLNDVALIIVNGSFSLSENVGTICLPSPNYVFAEKKCYASGWGKKEFGKLGVNQVIMKKIDLPIVPRSSCLALLRETRLGVDYILPEDFICAGGEIGKDTCKGDGGSPLMCPIENRPNQFQQAGIVAWGIGCGTKTPGVYVDVALFRNWIDEQMAKEKLSTTYYDPDYVPTN